MVRCLRVESLAQQTQPLELVLSLLLLLEAAREALRVLTLRVEVGRSKELGALALQQNLF